MKKSFTREELYNLVWSKPLTALAKEFNLSDTGLRKVCKKHNIPTPEMGYWQKIAFNKKANIYSLPQSEKVNIEFSEFEHPSKGKVNVIDNVFANKIYNNKQLIFKVPSQLKNPEKLTLKIQDSLNKNIKAQYGISDGIVRIDRELPQINVSVKSIPRTLRLFDTLLKNFKIIGYEIVIKESNMFIRHAGEEMKFYIREKFTIKKTPNKYGYNDTEKTPNGILCIKLVVFGDFEFSDNAIKLENKIDKILMKTEAKFQELIDWRLEIKKSQVEQDEKRRKEEGIKLVKQNELIRFKKIYDDALNWEKYLSLNNYFEYLKTNNKISDVEINWLQNKLDWFNPFIKKQDEYLSDKNREEIIKE
jgi:hypothetical protein